LNLFFIRASRLRNHTLQTHVRAVSGLFLPKFKFELALGLGLLAVELLGHKDLLSTAVAQIKDFILQTRYVI
jgi:hypothetical protein